MIVQCSGKINKTFLISVGGGVSLLEMKEKFDGKNIFADSIHYAIVFNNAWNNNAHSSIAKTRFRLFPVIEFFVLNLILSGLPTLYTCIE